MQDRSRACDEAPGAPGRWLTGSMGNSGISGGGGSVIAGLAGLGSPLLLLLGLWALSGRRRRRWKSIVLGGLLAAGALIGGLREASAQVSPSDFAERLELAGPINAYAMPAGERIGSLVRDRFGGELAAATRLWDQLERGLTRALNLGQSQAIDAPTIGGSTGGRRGLGDLRIAPKLAMARGARTALAVQVELGLPTFTIDDHGGNGAVTLASELALSHARGGLRLAANVGYRARAAARSLYRGEVDDGIYARGSLGYRRSSLELDATFDVATGADDVLGASNRNFAEVRGGGAVDLTPAVRVFGTASVGVAEAGGTPDCRAVVGLRFGRARSGRVSARHAPAPARPAPPRDRAGDPDPDRDGDGVVDRLDRCPDEPGAPELQGCKAPELVEIAPGKLEILDVVYFERDTAVIEPRSYTLLDSVARGLNAHARITKLRVEGHTDDQGDAAYNKQLSQRRADAVRAYLIDKGVDSSRLDAVGFGEEQPKTTNATAEGRAINRRVEFVIVGESDRVPAP